MFPFIFSFPRGVYILSDGGISVYGINPQTFSAEGFIAIPNRLLGNDYYAIGMPAETSDSQIGVVATRPGETEVTVTLPNNRDSLRVIIHTAFIIFHFLFSHSVLMLGHNIKAYSTTRCP